MGLCLDTRLGMDMDNLLPASRGGRQGFCSILLANSGGLLLALVFLSKRRKGFFYFYNYWSGLPLRPTGGAL